MSGETVQEFAAAVQRRRATRARETSKCRREEGAAGVIAFNPSIYT
jgi:hypothetical protein